MKPRAGSGETRPRARRLASASRWASGSSASRTPWVAHQSPARSHQLAVPRRELGGETGRAPPDRARHAGAHARPLRNGRVRRCGVLRVGRQCWKRRCVAGSKRCLGKSSPRRAGRWASAVTSRPVDLDGPLIRLLQPGDHPKQAGLTAPRWAHQPEDLAMFDRHIDPIERNRAIAMDQGDGAEPDTAHEGHVTARRNRAGSSRFGALWCPHGAHDETRQ